MDAAIPLQHTFVYEPKHIHVLLESQRHICFALKNLYTKCTTILKTDYQETKGILM